MTAAEEIKFTVTVMRRNASRKSLTMGNFRVRLSLIIALVFCAFCFSLPIGFVLASEVDKTRSDNNFLVAFSIASIGLLALFRAITDLRIELKFYAQNSLQADSQIVTQMVSIGGMSGKVRFFLYYPFVFFSGAFAVSFLVVYIKTNLGL